MRTKYFGELACPEHERVHFPRGFFGFEEEKDFFLLPFEGSGGSLLCFQSAATPGLAFVAMNPFSLMPGYAPELSGEDLAFLGVQESRELSFYVLCVVREPVGDSTLNLKCPVALNEQSRTAIQVILDTGAYQMHHRLAEFQAAPGGEEKVC